MLGAYILGGLIAVIGMIISARLRSKFKKYSKIPFSHHMSGKEIAEKMLHDHGIYDVKVTSVRGQLTDHYNPANKTVNLSEGVYTQRNAAAAAVAAHEVGHAVQHAKAYYWLTVRSRLVPVVSVASGFMHWLLLAGILMMEAFPNLLLIGILLFGLTTIFSFVTLPVEIDASRRALAWMKASHIGTSQEQVMSADALKWASYTYVVVAIGSLATLLYYVMIYMGGRD